MKRAFAVRIGLSGLFGLTVALAACGSEHDDDPQVVGPDAGVPGAAGCAEGLVTCNGDFHRECRNGAFVDIAECVAPRTCAPGYGCADCSPAIGQVCAGDELRTCRPDGQIGDVIEICGDGCEQSRCNTDCREGSKLVYVVDRDYVLLSFDPRDNAFVRVGHLDCPAGPSWPAWGVPGPATPFSMSVDRQERAWVLYTSGEIFWVDIRTAACTDSGFQPGQHDFELFGMGFVSDIPGQPAESLFVAGGPVGSLGRGRLARIDPATLALESIGALPPNDVGPEMTGNANAELFAYFPGAGATVARLDKATAQVAQSWPLPGMGDPPRAWAFAHWGGRYYIFVTTRDGSDRERSQVLRFDPSDGTTATVVADSPHRIVGAGVSTCAPVADF